MNAFQKKLHATGFIGALEARQIDMVTAHPRNFAARKDLISEGDEPGPLFIVLRGWACRYKILPSGTRQIMAFLMPGDSCDLHMNMVAEMDHSIQALTPASVAIVARRTIDQMMADFPNIAKAMYIMQLVDEGILRSWIVSMGRRTSIERFSHIICELFIRMKTSGLNTNGKFELPLTQVVLSDALGMTPVHINRVIKELRDAKAIKLGGGCLEICDAAKLVEIAGFDENYLHRRLSPKLRPMM